MNYDVQALNAEKEMTIDMAHQLYEKLNDPEYARDYFREAIFYNLSEQMIKARLKAGLTQQALAELAGTSQSAIARLERSNGNPSLKTIQHIFELLGCVLHLESVPTAEYVEREFKPPSGWIFMDNFAQEYPLAIP